ncbi:MAG TPA: hypothetical protein VLT79_00250 [Gemmatimonadales bacterium]|nr:hypothetical protein [Gemmatimonadales bacterium]
MASSDTLVTALNGVVNAREPFPWLATGGQPGIEHLGSLRRAGCDAVIDTRDPMEPQPFDPSVAAQNAHLTYINIPVPHSAPDDAVFERVRSTLTALHGEGKRVFVYCNSGNRVGAALIPYFMLELRLTDQQATAKAMEIGLRSAELLEAALAYVRRVRDSDASTSASR